MRRPHVENHFLADVVIGFARLGLSGSHSRHRIGRLNFTRREWHKIDNHIYAGE
jgi:hypothetical protein